MTHGPQEGPTVATAESHLQDRGERDFRERDQRRGGAINTSNASAGTLALAERQLPKMLFTSRELVGTMLSRWSAPHLCRDPPPPYVRGDRR